jgi:hypothetical protein
LKNLNVPATIVDRLFATDSTHMHYLNNPELELISNMCKRNARRIEQSTEYYPNGKWKSTTYDPVRIACYRAIIKELMHEGVKKYLASVGEEPTALPAPSGSTPR